MLVCYIDESGTGLNDPESPYFVLAAAMIHSSDTQTVDRQLTALKIALAPYAKPEDFEIKGRDLRQGRMLFKRMDWAARISAMQTVADLILSLPVKILAVRVDTRDLPDFVATDAQLYRLAFWRLLNEIDDHLEHTSSDGILLLDTQSTAHSSVQDRRVIDAFREWSAQTQRGARIIELPLFGFSAFYAGLQLADFAAYLVSFALDEEKLRSHEQPPTRQRNAALLRVYNTFQGHVRVIEIP
jgi:hypothetical protein